jgi:ABC-2 type transport system ATP-binding protein
VDRPRRALIEEPDDVESYVAKRSLRFTQADSGDRIVVRPARATRALEPSAGGTQAQTADSDQLGLSDPPTPRRALPAEPLSWDLEAQKASPTEPAAAGRRAIVDLEPTPAGGPAVPSQPTVPLAVRPAALEPGSIEPLPLREPAVDLPKIIAGAEPLPDPIFVPAQPAVDRAAASSGHQARPASWTVRHEVPAIVVDRLIKSYNGTLAVHNLSFVVEPGRVTGFLGPNGAGKTTTMRILLGLVAPTTGTATFGDLTYANLPRPQRTVGCVLDARFHPGRSGRNHLRVLAPTAGANDRRVDQLLGEVGLGEVARQPVGEYSMGMRQRLALAAAMLGNPDYLILDEPANGLDPEGIRWLRTFLRDFAVSGRAVFISSHLLNEIEATADDIVVINRGRLLAQLPMSELNLGEGTTRVRVSDVTAAVRALAAVGAEVETAADERGAFLRIHSHDVGQVGSALFSSGIAVDELSTERRDLEQEFFSMLEGSG